MQLFRGYLMAVLSLGGIAAIACKDREARPASALKVTNPLPDDGRHPEVVELIITFADGGRGRCSATFVAPNAVLTSAHCFFDKNGKRVRSISWTSASAKVYFGKAFAPTAFDHSMKDLDSLPYDLGFVTFTEPIAPRFAKISTAEPAAGQIVELVGFGRSDLHDLTKGGIKQRGLNRIRDMSGNLAELVGLANATNPDFKPGQVSLPSHGDSGGAVFERATGDLLGVIGTGVATGGADSPVGKHTLVHLNHPLSKQIMNELLADVCKDARLNISGSGR